VSTRPRGRHAASGAALALAVSLLCPIGTVAAAANPVVQPPGPPVASPAGGTPTEPSPVTPTLQLAPGPFADLQPGYWALPAITAVATAGLALVPSPHTFDPYGVQTRAAWVEQVYLAVEGATPAPPATAPFADVPTDLPSAGEIAQAKDAGWIGFPTAATFQPEAAITREQAFTVLALAFLGKDATGSAADIPFADASSIATWARGPIAALCAAGYIEGTGAGELLPQADLQRADAAALLAALLTHTLAANGHRYRVLQVRRLRGTAYGDGEWGMGTHTATGTHVHLGEAATDPRDIPYGTTLWVTGYTGYGYLPTAGVMEHVEDTGLLGPGDIDLYMPANNPTPYALFGIQPVTGYILDPTPLA